MIIMEQEIKCLWSAKKPELGRGILKPSLRRNYPVQVQRVKSQPFCWEKHPEESCGKIKSKKREKEILSKK